MKAVKLIAITGIISLSMALTACSVEVSQRMFVEGLAIDSGANTFGYSQGWTVTPKGYELEGEKSSEPEPVYGRTVEEALANCQSGMGKTLDFGHCKYILLGESVKSIREAVEPLEKGRRFPPGTLIFQSKGTSSEAIAQLEGDFLQEWEKSYGDLRTVSLDIVSLFKGSGDGVLPTLNASYGFEGGQLLHGGVVTAPMAPEQIKGFRLLNGTAEDFTATVEGEYSRETLVIKDSKVKIRPEDGASGLKFRIELTMKAETVDRKVPAKGSLDEAKRLIEGYAKSFLSLQNNLYTDPLNLDSWLKAYTPKARERLGEEGVKGLLAEDNFYITTEIDS